MGHTFLVEEVKLFGQLRCGSVDAGDYRPHCDRGFVDFIGKINVLCLYWVGWW